MNSVDLKPLLIDLEAEYNATGGKQATAVQPERLSEGGLKETLKRKAKEHRLAMRKWVNTWKEEHGCSSCGFKGHHFQLDLDHVDPETKRCSNHRSYEPNWRRERIENEIKKCVILCANCHRLKTFNNSDHLQVCDSPAHGEKYI